MSRTKMQRRVRRINKRNSKRSIEKIGSGGEVVAVYPSARAAARANFISYQAVLDRCRGLVKNPFALDGCTYRFQRMKRDSGGGEG